MVLLPLGVDPTTTASSAVGTSLPSLSQTRSKSVTVLPRLSTGRGPGDFPLGLSPADRSLLPQQQKQRRAKHVACQTESTELADLRQLQQHLFDVRQELDSVTAELSHAERRLRHEVREEMEERLRKYETRTKDKIAFLKEKQASTTTVMRKATKAQLESAKREVEHAIKVEHENLRAVDEQRIAQMEVDLEQKALLIAGYKRDNHQLQERVEQLQALSKGAAPSKKASELDVASATADLEAQLASRDATIQSLREQLSRLQSGGDPASAPKLAPSQSMPAVGAKGKKKA